MYIVFNKYFRFFFQKQIIEFSDNNDDDTFAFPVQLNKKPILLYTRVNTFRLTRNQWRAIPPERVHIAHAPITKSYRSQNSNAARRRTNVLVSVSAPSRDSEWSIQKRAKVPYNLLLPCRYRYNIVVGKLFRLGDSGPTHQSMRSVASRSRRSRCRSRATNDE